MGPELVLGMQVMGTFMTLQAGDKAAKAEIAAAQAKGTALDFQATQYEQQAGQERASGQRAALDTRRQQHFVESAAIARGAASGGGVADPGIADILGDIASEGQYRYLTQLYTGEEKARGLETQASAKRFEAGETRRGGYFTADATRTKALGLGISQFATALSGFGGTSLRAKYG